MNVTSFDSTKRPMEEMLKDAGAGKIQLPDFQRGWVWKDDLIKDLIASVSLAFPIGAVMMLEAGGRDVQFKTRPIEGAEKTAGNEEPNSLILDGQQRLTSLFQSLQSERPVATEDAKGNKTNRWYYLDMKKCLDSGSDREDAVISVPEGRRSKTFRGEITDLSTPEREYALDQFPLQKIFTSANWRQGHNQYWKYSQDKIELFNEFESQVIKRFEQYQVPVIQLDKDTPKEAVCLVFEKVNTRNVRLTVFELLTASFAVDNFQLRDDWHKRQSRLSAQPVLKDIENTSFLQAITLLVTKSRGTTISCKRRDVLRLTKDQYVEWAPRVEKGFLQAARFLREQKVFRSRDIPYQTQLVPLSAIFTDLDDAADSDGARQKIARWFWCGVLGEMYGSATETRFSLDLADVTNWVHGSSEEPRTIRDANFQSERLLTLRTRNSAGYKGVHALLMREGSLDFRKGEPLQEQTVSDDNIDIHHIFPRSWCDKPENAVPPNYYNSIINKTAIDAKTNRIIGGKAPSKYLHILESKGQMTPCRMDEILTTHQIPTSKLRSDDFWEFYGQRSHLLLNSIEKAMGKGIEEREQFIQSIEAKNSSMAAL